MPRNLGPFPLWEPPSPSTHLWEKLFQEALASSPDEEAGKEIRMKAIRRKENYAFLICERTAPEALLITVLASFFQKLNLPHFKCLLLQKPFFYH